MALVVIVKLSVVGNCDGSMHVALLSHEYPPFVFGGVGTLVRDLARSLVRKGTRVTVISGYPASPLAFGHQDVDNTEHGITVIRFPYPQIPPRHLLFQLMNYKRLSKVVQDIDPDVVHGQSASTYPALLNLKRFVPVVVTFHSNPKFQMISSLKSLSNGGGLQDFLTFGLGYPVWEYTFKKEFQESTANVAVSKTLIKELSAEISVNAKSFLCIKNGIDLEMLDSSCKSGNSNKRNDRFILVGARLFWNKGVLSMLRLAYLLQKKPHLNLRIVIFGSGPLYRTILREKRRLRLTNVELNPFAPRTEFMRAMRKAMFVAVPSFYEACPMVLLESMCMGKIPLLFDVPYAHEFTENGKYGILANSVQDMAQKIESSLNSGYLDELESKIRGFARKNYSIDVAASQYELLYEKLCN